MNLFLSAIAAFIATSLTIPLTIRFAKKYKLVDNPWKKPHPAQLNHRIVAKAGGIPIFLGLMIAIFLFIPIDKHILGIIFGTLILLIIGIIDDASYNLSPFIRLIFQFLAAATVVASGVGITFITNPLGGIIRLDEIIIPFNFLGQHSIVLIADLFALVWIAWMMNMVNWSWGVDGQMPGTIAIAALTIGLIALRQYYQGDNNQLNLALLSFITMGSSVAFLIFNWYPAKIFPGDSASNILAFMIAVLCILSSAKLATAVIVLLVPTIDSFYTIFRRIISKKSPFHGDKKHLHHLLLQRGWSHRQISLFYILSCAILGLVATNLSSSGKLFTIMGVGILLVGTILWLHHLSKDLQLKSQENEKH